MSGLAFEKPAAKRTAGISSLHIIAAESISEVICDSEGLAVGVIASESFSPVEFEEGGAWLKDTFQVSAEGLRAVRHELCFTLSLWNEVAGRLFGSLAECPPRGLVAVVGFACGETFLVGWSREFDLERPLRVESMTASTGARPTDPTGVTVTLGSLDTARSTRFTANI